jgi:hypothetical protein
LWLEDICTLNEFHGIDLKDNRTGKYVMGEENLIRYVSSFLGLYSLVYQKKNCIAFNHRGTHLIENRSG